jgi:hypothetical protein
MRHASWNSDKTPGSHDLRLIAHAELDLPGDEVEEMMAGRMCMAFDSLFQTVDPNVHIGRLGERGEPKSFMLLKFPELFDRKAGKLRFLGYGQRGE